MQSHSFLSSLFCSRSKTQRNTHTSQKFSLNHSQDHLLLLWRSRYFGMKSKDFHQVVHIFGKLSLWFITYLLHFTNNLPYLIQNLWSCTLETSKFEILQEGLLGSKFLLLVFFKTETTTQGELHTPLFSVFICFMGENTRKCVDLCVYVCYVWSEACICVISCVLWWICYQKGM